MLKEKAVILQKQLVLTNHELFGIKIKLATVKS